MIKKIMLVLSAVFIISTFAGAGYIFLHRGRVNLSSAGAEAEKESGEADRPSQALSLTEKSTEDSAEDSTADSAANSAADSAMNEAENRAEDGAKNNTENGAGEDGEGDYDTVLLDGARRLCRTYFKSGDFSYQIVITPGGRRNRNQLNVDVVKKDGIGYTVLNRLSMYYDPEYPFWMQSSMDQAAYQADGTIKEYQIAPSENGFIGLYGQLEAQGSYFPLDDLFMPEFFSRPLNETDLIGMTVADMKILRNQYYAVHGRIFEKQELRDYFQEKTWYLGDKTEDEFDETVFGGLEKRNIAFLKKAEAEFDEEKSKEVKKIYDGLLTAPYASLLTAHTEMGVSLYSDIQHRADKGIYYEAEGTIYTPVILSPKQYEAVMKEGKEERICVNELTKETAAVRRTDNSDYGDCMLFYDSGTESGKTSGEDTPHYYFLSYEPYSGNYTLWANSADTLFKNIYKGTVYVLKGAEHEWYQYFSIPDKEYLESGERVMRFDDITNQGAAGYGGGQPVFDEKGYLKAIYYYGD